MLLHVFTYIEKYIFMIFKFFRTKTPRDFDCVPLFIIMQKLTIGIFIFIVHCSAP